jgi:hypothetical protein
VLFHKNVGAHRSAWFRWALNALSVFLVAAVIPTQSFAKGFSVRYSIANEVVRVDYQDEKNFRFVPAAGLQTVVRNGDVFLVSTRAGDATTAMLVADRDSIARANRFYATGLATVSPKAVSTAAQTRREWQPIRKSLYETAFQRPGALRSRTITTTKQRSLSEAQAAMRTYLERMDMSVCGSSVRELVAWWVEELTSVGHAVVAVENGLQLQTPPTALSKRADAWLPKGITAADYRLPSAINNSQNTQR